MSFEPESSQAVTAARYERGDLIEDGPIFLLHAGRERASARPVFLYTLRPEYAHDTLFTDRLRAEVARAAGLRYPGIVTPYEVTGENGVTVVTEAGRGVHLKERIRRAAPFPLGVALDIAAAGAEALRAASAQGMAHGDLRPENIIITPDGQVRVRGFGIGNSLAASARTQLTALPELAPYLAPERAQGREPEPTADIYALGAILYEMLAGVTPFLGETPLAIAVKHLHDPVPPLRRYSPGVPPAVEGLVAKCLQKDPKARYASWELVLQDLQRAREDLRTGRPMNWQPAMPAAVAAGVVAAAAPPLPAAAPPMPAAAPHAPRPAARAAPILPQAEPEPDGPSGKVLLAGFLGMLLVIAIAYLAGLTFFRTPADVSVPGVLGKQRLAAEGDLQAAGLKPQVQESYNDKAPPGVVVLQEPEGNRAVKQGSAVRLFVSKGPEPATVPDVIGKPLKAAQAAVRDAQLTPGDLREEFSDSVTKGDVIAQDPAAGTSLTRRSPVALTVSKGPEPQAAPPPVAVNPSSGGDDSDATTDREWEVVVRVPDQPDEAQNVRIVVTDQDGTEHEEYNDTASPGDEVRQIVHGVGAKGTVRVRVFVNGKQAHEQKF